MSCVIIDCIHLYIVSLSIVLMHHTSLVIKVWDLLRNLGKIDTVLLDGIMIDSIEWLTERGVSWTLKIQWLNSTSIRVYVEELSATIQDICDLSWEDYENVLIRDKEIIYSSSVSSQRFRWWFSLRWYYPTRLRTWKYWFTRWP